jgi:hypothetical protein
LQQFGHETGDEQRYDGVGGVGHGFSFLVSEINRVQQLYVDHLHIGHHQKQNSGQQNSKRGRQGATGPETGFSSRYPKPGFLDTIPASLYQMIYM